MLFGRSVLILGLVLSGSVLRADDESEEFRAAWVARFEWASPDGEKL